MVRIPDTLLMAMEFLTLYTPSEHNIPLDDLRKLVTPCYPDILSRSNKTFWQRKVGAGGGVAWSTAEGWKGSWWMVMVAERSTVCAAQVEQVA